MTVEELMRLRTSNEAPFDHRDYTIWLHNKIVERIKFDLWQFRENKSEEIKSTYAACNHIMSLEALKKAE